MSRITCLFTLILLVFTDREAQPAARCALSSLLGRWEDEGVSQDDPIPGVVGRSQALRQSSPSRQHDHRQWHDQHHCECSLFVFDLHHTWYCITIHVKCSQKAALSISVRTQHAFLCVPSFIICQFSLVVSLVKATNTRTRSINPLSLLVNRNTHGAFAFSPALS